MKKIAFFALLLSTMTSCMKIIEVDLNTTDPKVIIEGDITDEADGFKIKISKTVNFSAANNFPPVKGAVVTITDNTGSVQTLTESTAGIYTLKNTKGVSGKTYTLKVVAEGKTYTASSTMPKVVDLLGLEIELSPFNQASFTDKFYDIYPFFLDPAADKNNYLFFVSSKGKKEKGFSNVINDNLFNGSYNPFPLGVFDLKLKPTDTVTVEMRCIDKPVYDYYYSLNQISDNGDSATPANPVSNITGGALGYFSAHTVRKATVIVP
jgi:Domain of unknown function (DUF4249)